METVVVVDTVWCETHHANFCFAEQQKLDSKWQSEELLQKDMGMFKMINSLWFLEVSTKVPHCQSLSPFARQCFGWFPGQQPSQYGSSVHLHHAFQNESPCSRSNMHAHVTPRWPDSSGRGRFRRHSSHYKRRTIKGVLDALAMGALTTCFTVDHRNHLDDFKNSLGSPRTAIQRKIFR